MFLLAALFGAGLLHGLGPDHLAALAALAGRRGGRCPEKKPAAWLGVRFGLGHAATLLLLAGAAWVLGRELPVSLQRALEQFGGLVLVFLGGGILAQALHRRLVLHSHPHAHSPGDTLHQHPHIHLTGGAHAAHAHPHFPALVGGLLGFSGAQSLLVALPLVAAGSLATALARLAAFGLGIVVSMSAAGWLLEKSLARISPQPAAARAFAGATGALCAAVGLYWLARFGG